MNFQLKKVNNDDFIQGVLEALLKIFLGKKVPIGNSSNVGFTDQSIGSGTRNSIKVTNGITYRKWSEL